MTQNQQRIIVALFVGLMFFGAVFLTPVGPESPGDLWSWSRFGLGAVLAQVSLVATWAALRRRSWVEGVPPLLGLACLYGTMVQGVAARYPAFRPRAAEGTAFVAPPLFLLLIVAFGLLHRFRGWEIVAPDEAWPPAESGGRAPVQFTIRHLFLWLTGAAVCLAFGVWLVRMPQTMSALQSPLLVAQATGVAALVAAFTLPMLVPSLGMMLADRGRAWFALTLGLLFLAGPFVLNAPTMWQLSGRVNWLSYLGPLAWTGTFELGLAGVFCGVLVITRLCGYRLKRGHAPVVADRPVPTRSRFGLVVSLLVFAFLLLCWPVAREREMRRWAVACQEWQQSGVDAYYDGLYEGLGLIAEAKQPLPQATLDRLAVPEYAAQIVGVGVDAPSTDLQMPRLGKLEHLRFLNLAKSGLSDAGLVSLADLKQLQTINLSGTQVTAEGVARLQRALPNCQILGAPAASPAAAAVPLR